MKRARSNSYGNYNEVSQSQDYGYMPRSNFKSSGKLYKKKSLKKISKEDINRAISRRLENKVIVDYTANQTIIPADAGTGPTIRYMLPVISQGLGQGNRIGNQVHVRSGKITMFVNLNTNANSVNQAPLWVRVWLLSYKLVNSNSAPSFATFFQTGSTNAPFQKNMLDMILPVNKDQFTVYEDKTIKLGVAEVLATNTNIGNNRDNSSYTEKIEFDWGSHFKSALEFNDTDNVPINRNLFLVWTTVQANGTSIVSTTDSGTEYHLTNTITYEDG